MSEKYFDVRTSDRYLSKGIISKKDMEAHLKSLPNDEDNFELSTLEDDDIGVGNMSDDELASLPPIREEDIDNFDFMEDEDTSEEPTA